MTRNLLKDEWKNLDSNELMILLYERIGRPGQYDDAPNIFYLPLAGSSCRVALAFREKRIVAIEPREAFDAAEWERIRAEIDELIHGGLIKVGREYSFSSFRITGSWKGTCSGIQILPPPDDAPLAPYEMADHPFILEFPIKATDCWPITNHRRVREHRRLTLLLNVLLRGHTNLLSNRPAHFWAGVPNKADFLESKWLQQFYSGNLGNAVLSELSSPAGKQLEEVEPEDYYMAAGHDGTALRVPADLDQSICIYLQLSRTNRATFDRAAYWLDMASRQWPISASSSFASLVSAVESLTKRGDTHKVYCNKCNTDCTHEVPSATARFRAALENYAPGAALKSRRDKMYSLRSAILHGSELMQLDQDLYPGWYPPGWDEKELYDELWGLTRIALRNWLKNPPDS